MDRKTDRARSALWIYDVDKQAHSPLITAGAYNRSPRWSPNGDRLLYMHAGASGAELRVLYIESDKDFSVTQLDRPPQAAVW